MKIKHTNQFLMTFLYFKLGLQPGIILNYGYHIKKIFMLVHTDILLCSMRKIVILIVLHLMKL